MATVSEVAERTHRTDERPVAFFIKLRFAETLVVGELEGRSESIPPGDRNVVSTKVC